MTRDNTLHLYMRGEGDAIHQHFKAVDFELWMSWPAFNVSSHQRPAPMPTQEAAMLHYAIYYSLAININEFDVMPMV